MQISEYVSLNSYSFNHGEKVKYLHINYIVVVDMPVAAFLAPCDAASFLKSLSMEEKTGARVLARESASDAFTVEYTVEEFLNTSPWGV